MACTEVTSPPAPRVPTQEKPPNPWPHAFGLESPLLFTGEKLRQLTLEASQSQPTFQSSLRVSYLKYLGYGEVGLVKGSGLEVGVLAIGVLDMGSVLPCSILSPTANAQYCQEEL